MSDLIQLEQPEEGGIYIHVPFCRKKCIYCDFYSIGIRNVDLKKYTDCVIKESRDRKNEHPVVLKTLYIGGGTPSILPIECLEEIVGALKNEYPESFSGSGNLTDPFIFNGEFTLEVNPEDVTEEKCREWLRLGVNRVSMGIQSFFDDELNMLRRSHSSQKAKESLGILTSVFNNVSIDLIFGLPGQTEKRWIENLKSAVDSGVQHISLYSLMFEEGTALTMMRNQGRISEISETLSDAMFHDAIEILGKSGFSRYEISNYSLPGFESKHNQSYWIGTPYLGLGPGAHSYDGMNCRRSNAADIKGYLMHYSDNDTHGEYLINVEHLNIEEMREEFLMTRLRMKKGFKIDEFRKKFGYDATINLLKSVDRLKDYVKMTNDNIALTDSGVMISDKIILDLSM